MCQCDLKAIINYLIKAGDWKIENLPISFY